jgi:predicted MFS family arabinose efflux permease
LSVFNAATNLGMLLGMGATGLWVVTVGYRGAFTVVILFALLYAALAGLLTPLPDPLLQDHPPRPPERRTGLGFRLGRLWLAACCAFVGATTWAMSSSFYPVYLSRLHYGEQSIGLLVMLVSAGMLCTSFVSRAVVGEGARLRRLALGFVAGTGLGLAAVPAFQSWLPLAGLILVTGFCSGGCNMIYQRLVQQHSAWNARGAAMAAVGLFGNLALLILPTAIGIALTWVSLEAAWVAAGLLVTLLGAAVTLSVKGVERPAAIAPGQPIERDAART